MITGSNSYYFLRTLSMVFSISQSETLLHRCHVTMVIKYRNTKGNLFDDSVIDINPTFTRPCPGIDLHLVTYAFERYF